MAKRQLKQYMRGEDGILYGPGEVDVPKSAGLKLSKSSDEDETREMEPVDQEIEPLTDKEFAKAAKEQTNEAEENTKKAAAVAKKANEGKK